MTGCFFFMALDVEYIFLKVASPKVCGCSLQAIYVQITSFPKSFVRLVYIYIYIERERERKTGSLV